MQVSFFYLFPSQHIILRRQVVPGTRSCIRKCIYEDAACFYVKNSLSYKTSPNLMRGQEKKLIQPVFFGLNHAVGLDMQLLSYTLTSLKLSASVKNEGYFRKQMFFWTKLEVN